MALIAPPGRLTVASATQASVAVSWSPVRNATSYDVSSSSVVVARVSGTSYVFMWGCGVSHPVKVRSVTTGGRTSKWSGQVTAATLPCDQPGGGAPVGSSIVWSGGESLADWAQNGDGGLYNSGQFEAVMDPSRMRSGAASLRATIWTPSAPASGVRAFRWGELHTSRTLVLSAWYYIPTAYTTSNGGWWTLMEIKTKNQDGSRVDPVYAFRVENIGGTLYPYINWGAGGLQLAGPHQGDTVSIKAYRQADRPPVPVGSWFKVTFELTQASDHSGAFAAWVGDYQLYSATNIVTAYPVTSFNTWQTNNHWAATSYSDSLTPNPAVIWIDDAAEALP